LEHQPKKMPLLVFVAPATVLVGALPHHPAQAE
jgi:hypothetical protein